MTPISTQRLPFVAGIVMADKTIRPSPRVTPAQQTTGGVCAVASANAPFVYFDSAPNFGFNGNVANISLEVVRFSPTPNGDGVATDRVTVAHLRMTIEAMRSLKAAIEGVEHLALMAHARTRN
jgi:hypothetical protein